MFHSPESGLGFELYWRFQASRSIIIMLRSTWMSSPETISSPLPRDNCTSSFVTKPLCFRSLESRDETARILSKFRTPFHSIFVQLKLELKGFLYYCSDWPRKNHKYLPVTTTIMLSDFPEYWILLFVTTRAFPLNGCNNAEMRKQRECEREKKLLSYNSVFLRIWIVRGISEIIFQNLVFTLFSTLARRRRLQTVLFITKCNFRVFLYRSERISPMKNSRIFQHFLNRYQIVREISRNSEKKTQWVIISWKRLTRMSG